MATSMRGVESKVNQMNAFDMFTRQASDTSTASPSPSGFPRQFSELDSDFDELHEEMRGPIISISNSHVSKPNTPKLLARRGSQKLQLEQLAVPLPAHSAVNQDLLDSYQVTTTILGCGTTSVVKLAVQKASPYKEFAVKVWETSGDEEKCVLAKQEFELLKSLKHPGIIQVYEFCIAPDMSKSLLVMELVRGQTLQALVCNDGPMKEWTLQPLFKQLASVVHYMHGQRVVHRDLKPDNLLIDDDLSRLHLCDFNFAKSLTDGGLLTPRLGTLGYTAPEILLGEGSWGPPADIWSAGLCLFFALSGDKPSSWKRFVRHPAKCTLSDWHAWFKCLNVDSNSLVAQCLCGCMNPDPAQRLDSVLLLAHPWMSLFGKCSQDGTYLKLPCEAGKTSEDMESGA